MTLPESSRISLLGLASLVLVGCTSEAEPVRTAPTPPPAAPVEAPAEPVPVPFEIGWGTCSIPVEGGKPIQAECATVDAPARRGVEGSGTTPVAVYRLRSEKQPATAQMWMLNGGPGAAGFTLAPYAQRVTSRFPGMDVYLVDHRGTGGSAQLGCPEAERTVTSQNDYMRACSKELRRKVGDAIDGFSTTEVAHDVRELIDSTATSDQKVFVYGGSYGTYLAHRLLQLPGVRVDAVVTDGTCLGTTCSFGTPQAFRVDEAMRHVMDVCRDTPSCTARLGVDPWAFTKATVAKLARGHCAATALRRQAPADWAAAVGVHWAAGLAPTLYRLDRCSTADVAVLDTLARKVMEVGSGRLVSAPPFGPPPKPTAENAASVPLMFHVAASEMISKPAPSADALARHAETLVFKPHPRSLDLSFFDEWKGYPPDAYVGGWAQRDVPWLMMHGTFDFQTEFSLTARALDHIRNPSVQLVRVDGGGHGVVFASECSLSILQGFLADPRAKVDTTCLVSVKKASLTLREEDVSYFFGSTDAWGDAP